MYLAKFKHVTTFILDVDGVLTDGTVLVTKEGQLLRSMNIKDGYALQHAVKNNYKVIVISGGTSEGVRIRLNKLGISEVHLGVQDKKTLLSQRLNALGVKKENCLAMGDDVPDKVMFEIAGCSACPADAVQEVKSSVDYVSPINGGRGAVRDVIETVMKLSGSW